MTTDTTQESVKLKESVCGECTQSLSAHADVCSFYVIWIFALAKRSLLLNMTSGSLEAFGGEISRAEL